MSAPLWRCIVCGRFSQRQRRPASHRRHGERCGPFEAASEPERALAALKPRETYRQSLLAGMETCPRRTLHSLQVDGDLPTGYVGATADLGQVAHDVFAEILRTMHRHGMRTMPTQEAVETMYEVMARTDHVLPADEREALKGMTLNFVARPWDTRRILGLETPLETEIVCPDGVVRKLTGRPDLLIADPPDAIIVVDYKTGRAQPKQPRKPVPDDEVVIGKQYLSDRGHYQLDSYGLLVFRRWPAAQRVSLREYHLRSGAVREADLSRVEAEEHVQRELGAQMMLVERGISEGPASLVWRPRPGAHCLKQCPVATSCPIPAERRGDGAVRDREDADRQAQAFPVVDAQRQQLRERLKAYHDATGYAPRVGDGKVMRWKQGKASRSFGMHDPEPPPSAERAAEDERALERALEESLAARGEAA